MPIRRYKTNLPVAKDCLCINHSWPSYLIHFACKIVFINVFFNHLHKSVSIMTDINWEWRVYVCIIPHYSVYITLLWGVRGRVLKVVDFKPLAPHRCGFESRQAIWILSCEEAIQLAYERRWFYSGARSCLK
jgi:hypothetical protein